MQRSADAYGLWVDNYNVGIISAMIIIYVLFLPWILLCMFVDHHLAVYHHGSKRDSISKRPAVRGTPWVGYGGRAKRRTGVASEKVNHEMQGYLSILLVVDNGK